MVDFLSTHQALGSVPISTENTPKNKRVFRTIAERLVLLGSWRGGGDWWGESLRGHGESLEARQCGHRGREAVRGLKGPAGTSAAWSLSVLLGPVAEMQTAPSDCPVGTQPCSLWVLFNGVAESYALCHQSGTWAAVLGPSSSPLPRSLPALPLKRAWPSVWVHPSPRRPAGRDGERSC